jgi:hypothetical protein
VIGAGFQQLCSCGSSNVVRGRGECNCAKYSRYGRLGPPPPCRPVRTAALLLTQYRPKALEEFQLHSDVANNLRKLVRQVSSALATSRF